MFALERVAGYLFVRVGCDIDLATAPTFENLMRRFREEPSIAVDLRRCAYFDSTGISVLCTTLRSQRVVILAVAGSAIHHALQAGTFDAEASTCHTIQDALELLSQKAGRERLPQSSVPPAP